MDPSEFIDPQLTPADRLVLDSLLKDVDRDLSRTKANASNCSSLKATDSGYGSAETSASSSEEDSVADDVVIRRRKQRSQSMNSTDRSIEQIRAANDAHSPHFEPTVFVMWDLRNLKLPPMINGHLLQPYIRWARTIARHDTDVVMITHLILYLATTIPSALYLYHHFTYPHALLHWVMQSYYVGTYTLMMHQHIHQRGILSKRLSLLDAAFPYLLDPLFGHTWNSYHFHHVKHHHVEGNGPDDISSTIRYQRDSPAHFALYVARFCFFVWVDLPAAFIRRGQWRMAAKTAFFEFSTYGMYYLLASYVSFRATLFVYLLPFALLRLGLMIGNWGQHCFVDEAEPDSDFRSSITLLDVASNRFCFNDGYHTSHHLNPMRHWRDHPLSFLKQKDTYAAEHALVFRNIDYLMITLRVLRKDYWYLAGCLVPIGAQVGMSREELASMLERKTRRFSEEEIVRKFGKGA